MERYRLTTLGKLCIVGVALIIFINLFNICGAFSERHHNTVLANQKSASLKISNYGSFSDEHNKTTVSPDKSIYEIAGNGSGVKTLNSHTNSSASVVIMKRSVEKNTILTSATEAYTVKNSDKGNGGAGADNSTNDSPNADKRTVIFYSPHPDDEVLSMGMAIAENIARGNTVHVVLLTHGYDSNAIGVLNGKEYCQWHKRKHNPGEEGYHNLSRGDLGNLRVQEFTRSVLDLGVPKDNIHIFNFDEDRITPFEVKTVILGFEKLYQNSLHCTSSYHDSHPFHSKLGEVLLELYNNKLVNDTLFYINPVQWKSVNGIFTADQKLKERVENSLGEYRKFRPEAGELGIGYHSYPKPFGIVENDLESKYHKANE